MRKTDRHLLFHGSIFSNWAPSPFDGKAAYAEMRARLDALGIAGHPEGLEITGRLRGRRYANGEQWMMAAKAWLMGDLETLKRIHQTSDPKAVKALGREVRPFDAKLWDKACVPIVTAGCIAKFGATDRMRRELLDTGDLVIVEASRFDRVWGIGIDWRDPEADDPAKWRGRNLLGKCLMEARSVLAQAGE